MFRQNKMKFSLFAKILILTMILSLVPLLFFGLFNYSVIDSTYNENSKLQIENKINAEIEQRSIVLEREAESIAMLFKQIEQNLFLLQKQTEYLLQTSSYEESYVNRMLYLSREPEGYQYEPFVRREDSANLFVSGITNDSSQLKKELVTLKELETLFREVISSIPMLQTAWFCTSDSVAIAYPAFDYPNMVKKDPAAARVDFRNMPFYKVADEKHNPGKKVQWTEPYNYFSEDQWVISASIPVYIQNELKGVIGVDLPIVYLTKSLVEARLGDKEAFSFLLDSRGSFIAGKKENLFQSFLEKTGENEVQPGENNVHRFSAISKLLLNRGELTKIKTEKEEYYVFSREIKTNQWLYSFAIPASKIAGPVIKEVRLQEQRQLAEVRKTVLLGFLFTAMIVIYFSYNFSYKVTSPIKQLTRAIQNFTKGRPGFVPPGNKDDEISQLARTYNTMAETIQNLITNLNERADQLQQKSEALKYMNGELIFANERLKQSEDARSDLIIQISHDLKTPLTSIKGFLQLMDKYSFAEEDRVKYRKIIASKLNYLTELIDDLYHFSSNEQVFLLDLEVLPIDFLIEHSIEMAKIEGYGLNLVFEEDIEEELPLVHVDSKRLSRVFYNILTNAIKYSRNRDTIIITVHAYASGESIIIEIKDNGMGIAAENLTKVFEKFYREPRMKDAKITGTGLGMAISKKIIEEHKGTITIDSVVEEGTKVTITLPVYNEF